MKKFEIPEGVGTSSPAPTPFKPLVIPPASPVHARVATFLEVIDTNANGVPFYRDGAELRGLARWAWRILKVAAAFVGHATVASRIVDAGTRAGVDSLLEDEGK